MAGRPLNSTLTICMGYFRPIAISKKDSVRAERVPVGPGLGKVVADCWELVSFYPPYRPLTHSDTGRRDEPSQG